MRAEQARASRLGRFRCPARFPRGSLVRGFREELLAGLRYALPRIADGSLLHQTRINGQSRSSVGARFRAPIRFGLRSRSPDRIFSSSADRHPVRLSHSSEQRISNWGDDGARLQTATTRDISLPWHMILLLPISSVLQC